MRVLLANLLTILALTPVWAGEFSGRVVGVLDGDTIGVLHNQHPERIRFHSINCGARRELHLVPLATLNRPVEPRRPWTRRTPKGCEAETL